ncbi:MAG: threonylcarbamoyl-AMP synthase [Bacteroidales bacterium]|nr:threonylcarbamoyl-AMP synthase [Bacteroidales bacterium]
MQEDINKALKVLQNGGVILYPTDTIWGIGCDAKNEKAVEKIYKIKKRDDKKSMLILLNNINHIYSYVEDVPEIALDIVELATKPTTIIYQRAKNLAENLIAEDGSIGIRITSEKFTDKLLQRFKNPVVSTSANVSGDPAPENFYEISEKIKLNVDYIVNYKQDIRANQASSIIKIGLSNEIKVIRE